MAKKNKATLSSEKDALFADNTAGDISAQDMRDQTQDDIDSFLNSASGNPEQEIESPVDFTGGLKKDGAEIPNFPDAAGKRYGDQLTLDDSEELQYQQKVWQDLTGEIIARTSGPTDPNFTSFRGNIDAYAFGNNEEVQLWFHMPHDYAVGTDLYLHVHWGHNGTAISGNQQWDYYATYAKGHDQANFPAEVSGSIIFNTVDIATTPQYRHRIDEIQLSALTPSASQLDTNDIEVDGLLGINIKAGSIASISGGSPNEPFIFCVDIHYQSDIIGTKNKAPNFYL